MRQVIACRVYRVWGRAWNFPTLVSPLCDWGMGDPVSRDMAEADGTGSKPAITLTSMMACSIGCGATTCVATTYPELFARKTMQKTRLVSIVT